MNPQPDAEYCYNVMMQIILPIFISVCHQKENLNKSMLLGDYICVI